MIFLFKKYLIASYSAIIGDIKHVFCFYGGSYIISSYYGDRGNFHVGNVGSECCFDSSVLPNMESEYWKSSNLELAPSTWEAEIIFSATRA